MSNLEDKQAATIEPLSVRVLEAIALLRSEGYRVSAPRAPKAIVPALNAVGKPYSPQFDPNYRMKYKPRRYACGAHESQNIGNGGLYGWDWENKTPAKTGIPRVWEL